MVIANVTSRLCSLEPLCIPHTHRENVPPMPGSCTHPASPTGTLRGERNLAEGNLSRLLGVDFNINGKLNATLYSPFTAVIDRAAGTMTVTLPDFVPGNTIAYPSGATHFKIVVGAAQVNFASEAFVFDRAESAEIVLGPQNQATFDLVGNVTAASAADLFLVLGLEFMQQVNGAMYPLKNGAYNPLAIIQLDEA